MPRFRMFFLLAALALGAGPACAGEAGEAAKAWVQQGAALIDVRSAEEFAGGHLDGAKNIPVQELEARAAEVPKGKVVVYCHSGSRSARAARLLRERGYEVLDLGAMDSWPR